MYLAESPKAFQK